MSLIINLTPQQIEQFQKQKFCEHAPGTLLKDFGALLEFIGPKGIEVSKLNHLFAGKYLSAINALLTRPLVMQLKRPQQKSYPAINGLYLLLRASGLAYVDMHKKPSRLMLNQKVLDCWLELNALERYFALFEAWWLRGSNEIIGERDAFQLQDNYFYPCIDFYEHYLCKQANISIGKETLDYFRYLPGFHLLALLELFGLIDLYLDATLSQGSWPLVQLKLTSWGKLLIPVAAEGMGNDYLSEDRKTHALMPLLDTLKSIRQDLQNTLLLPGPKLTANAAVVLKISLGNASRTLCINSSVTLDELADALLNAFAFDKDHLYAFTYKNSFGVNQRIAHPEACFDDDAASTSTYRLCDLHLDVGLQLTFLFDFGEHWEFLLWVEAIDTENTPPAKPKIIKREGSPPEQYSGEEVDFDFD
jgi:hypothetical protein